MSTPSYAQLFENNRRWVADELGRDPEHFERLAAGQHPRYLFIGCSDSRVNANEMVGVRSGDVRANTVPAFALGDYEWILAFEAPELYRIVDLMRELRATDARRHTREETPFFTGPRVSVEELVTRLP